MNNGSPLNRLLKNSRASRGNRFWMNDKVESEEDIELKYQTSDQRCQSPKDVPPKGLRRFLIFALLRLGQIFYFNIFPRRASQKCKKSPATRYARVLQQPVKMEDYHMPAEWEPHEATWLAWPHNIETWPNGLEPVRDIWVQMIEALCPHEKVYILVNDEKTADEVRVRTGKIREGISNIFPVVIPNDDAWMRDAGPIFLTAKNYKSYIIQDFIFNTWGKKYGPWDKDDEIPVHVAAHAHVPFIKRKMVLEGGSIDVNGKGTVLTTKQCLLNKNRNPHLSQKQIEDNLKEYLGVSNVLWLDDGIEGDDTDGHVDDITRFVNPTTVVTVVESNKKDANYEPLQSNLRKLKNMLDQDGHALNIVEMPMPNRVEGPFGRSPASYGNFYIANHVVLVPIYSSPQDKDALQILQNVFPKRKIIGIECTPLVAGLGAIHCVTQQQPI